MKSKLLSCLLLSAALFAPPAANAAFVPTLATAQGSCAALLDFPDILDQQRTCSDPNALGNTMAGLINDGDLTTYYNWFTFSIDNLQTRADAGTSPGTPRSPHFKGATIRLWNPTNLIADPNFQPSDAVFNLYGFSGALVGSDSENADVVFGVSDGPYIVNAEIPQVSDLIRIGAIDEVAGYVEFTLNESALEDLWAASLDQGLPQFQFTFVGITTIASGAEGDSTIFNFGGPSDANTRAELSLNVPEPGSLPLLAMALGGLLLGRGRRAGKV